MLDEPFIAGLLYEDEGPTLDFKRDQYRFYGASDAEKAELLKDILAFVNAWRRVDAYILIGVDERPGGRAVPVGVTEQLKDADLQQFVNSKTNAPVELSCFPETIDGISIGVIRIPVQERPRYLLKQFGGLKHESVYLRRGSSTDTAKPDEVARMGAPLGEPPFAVPKLRVQLADLADRRLIGESTDIASEDLVLEDEREVPDYEIHAPTGVWGVSLPDPIRRANKEYFRLLVRYMVAQRVAQPLRFAITNEGSVTATDVRVELTIISPDVLLWDEETWPSRPKAEFNLLGSAAFPGTLRDDAIDVTVKRLSDRWVVELFADKIQPLSTAWLRDALYFGSKASGEIILEGAITADNVPVPQPSRLFVRCETKREVLSAFDILDDAYDDDSST